jgi:hypothetical protein
MRKGLISSAPERLSIRAYLGLQLLALEKVRLQISDDLASTYESQTISPKKGSDTVGESMSMLRYRDFLCMLL